MSPPGSCTAFVVLGSSSKNGHVIFGKNSDRPTGEIQEVAHVPARQNDPNTKVKCTYIEIDNVTETYECILSKIAWNWGAEMGANEHGVCIGNAAAFTKLVDDTPRLLGMDLLRLGLERSRSASQALDVMTNLLETHGQGGQCKEGGDFIYHNGFLIADRKEVWVLETVGKHWAARHITDGVYAISSAQLSIRKQFDKHSTGLIKFARDEGCFSGEDDEFDFAAAFSDEAHTPQPALSASDEPCNRHQWANKLLQQYTHNNDFSTKDMFTILRHKESEICRQNKDHATMASQVSVLPSNQDAIATHWFTATPYPHWSLFKPFVFCKDASIGDITGTETMKTKQEQRKHKLYLEHEKFCQSMEKGDPKALTLLETLREMEVKCLEDMDEMTSQSLSENQGKLAQIYRHMAQLEINFYSM